MVNKKFPKNKPITIPVQKFNIRKQFKKMIIKEYKCKELKMLLKVQPTEISKEYNVLLQYDSVQRKPQVYVSVEQLNIDDKENIPHKYGIKNINGEEYVNLCLYYPGEWNSTMNISDTIIPWISEWLCHFEYWSITGKWCGGGKHPTKKDIKENDKN